MPVLVNPVPASVEVDRLLGPQELQQLDLLLATLPACVEVLAKGNVLLAVAAHADAQTQAAAAQDVDLGGLLGNERRLAHRQDNHRRDQLDAGCQGGDVAQQGQGFVQMPAVRARHLVRDTQVREAELLGCLREVAYRRQVVLELPDRMAYKSSGAALRGVASMRRETELVHVKPPDR